MRTAQKCSPFYLHASGLPPFFLQISLIRGWYSEDVCPSFSQTSDLEGTNTDLKYTVSCPKQMAGLQSNDHKSLDIPILDTNWIQNNLRKCRPRCEVQVHWTELPHTCTGTSCAKKIPKFVFGDLLVPRSAICRHFVVALLELSRLLRYQLCLTFWPQESEDHREIWQRLQRQESFRHNVGVL